MECGVFKFVQFLMASAGASALLTGWARDFRIVRKVSYGTQVLSPLNKKPFTCSLCMGFYLSPAIWWMIGVRALWSEFMVASLIGAAFSWLFHSKITGED